MVLFKTAPFEDQQSLIRTDRKVLMAIQADKGIVNTVFMVPDEGLRRVVIDNVLHKKQEELVVYMTQKEFAKGTLKTIQ